MIMQTQEKIGEDMQQLRELLHRDHLQAQKIITDWLCHKKEKVIPGEVEIELIRMLGIIETKKRSYDKAFNFFLNAYEKWSIEQFDGVWLSQILVDFSVLYSKRGRLKQALKFLNKASKTASKHQLANLYSNFGSILYKMGEARLSIKYYENALKYAEREYNHSTYPVILINFCLLKSKIQVGEVIQAEKVDSMIELARRSQFNDMVTFGLLIKAKIAEQEVKSASQIYSEAKQAAIRSKLEHWEESVEDWKKGSIDNVSINNVRSNIPIEDLLSLNVNIRDLEKSLEDSHLRLTLLRSRFNPHFLFNCLTGISGAVISGNTINAVEVLRKLAKVFRDILKVSKSDKLPLKQDVAIIKNYLDIEQRLRDKDFNYYIESNKDVYTIEDQVPSLIIQPLVENCIKHGIPLKRDGKIVIKYILMQATVKIIIEDNGRGFPDKVLEQKGTARNNGLKIVEERLRLYNESEGTAIYRMTLENKYHNGRIIGSRSIVTLRLWKN
jgi:tetratricopeptide (TPR) repeat protein